METNESNFYSGPAKTEAHERRDELLQQRENIAHVWVELSDKIKQEPDNIEDLKKSVDELSVKYFLTPEQNTFTHTAIEKYAQRRVSLRRAAEEYPDGAKLFAAVFGFEPQGEVVAIRGLMTVHFRCMSEDDLQDVWLKGRGLTRDSKPKSKMGRAFMTNQSLLDYLKGMITVGAGDLERESDVIDHEFQHSLFNMLFPNAVTSFWGKGLKPEDTKEIISEKIVTTAESWESMIERKAQDEILAWIRMGRSSKEALPSLIGKHSLGYYDYTNIHIGRAIDTMTKLYPGHDDEVEDTLQHVAQREDLDQKIKDGYKAAEILMDPAGLNWSKEKTIALLSFEPLNKWLRTAESLASRGK